jgi:ribosomal protein S18 acetylase RimI-like enzyme
MFREATSPACTARVARPEELEQVRLLVSWSEHAHLRFQLEYLPQLVGEGHILAIGQGEQLSGIAYVTLDYPNSSIRGLVVRSSRETAQVVQATLNYALPAARALGALSLNYIGDDAWLTPHLTRAGFSYAGQIIGLNRPGAFMTARGNTACEVRPADEHDLPSLVAIDWSAFEPLWRNGSETTASFLEQMPCFLLASVNGQPLGYICGSAHARTGHIVRLAVRQDVRRHGIGTRLMHDALAWLSQRGVRSLSLNTQAENSQSQAFYRALGFYRVQSPSSVYRYLF